MRDVTAPDHVALGESEEFLQLQEQIRCVAGVDRPVIFIGERGTGKELAATRLHLLSGRWNNPYVTLNCATLSPTLIESELFGHEAGAFTDAARRREGRFELAHTGSLFLDEVADIPLPAQEKILRVVEYGRFERVGGGTTIESDVRLIAATNRDLRALAREGRFRPDLLDRLAFEVITLPPLRARHGDVLLLARHFARRMAAELGLTQAPRFSPSAERTLLAHDWPGNIRELKNAVERSMYRSGSEVITDITLDPFDSRFAPATRPDSLPATRPARSPMRTARTQTVAAREDGVGGTDAANAVRRLSGAAELESGGIHDDLDALPLNEAVDEFRVRLMQRALRAARFNQRLAARRLGLTYDQFRGYYRKNAERFRSPSRDAT